MLVQVAHSGLRMVLVNRESVGLLGEDWRCLGVYFLIGPGDDPDRFRAYVGEVGKSTLVQRVKQHAIGKEWWSRALLMASVSNDFNSAEIGYLEGRLYDVLHNALACDVMNGNRPLDESLSLGERLVLEKYVEPIMAALRACGAPPDTADQKPVPKGKKPKKFTETLADVIAAGLLKPNTQLQPLKKGLSTVATVLPDGQLRVEGVTYTSPSGAAKAVAGTVAESGWDFWGAPSGDGGHVALAKLRARLRETSALERQTGARVPPSALHVRGLAASTPAVGTKTPQTMKDLIDRGLLAAGAALRPARKTVSGVATVAASGEIIFGGQSYKSPSGAAKAASGQRAEAGWDFWIVEATGVRLAELRAKMVSDFLKSQ